MSSITHTPKAKTRTLLQSQQMYNSKSLGGKMKIYTRTSNKKAVPRVRKSLRGYSALGADSTIVELVETTENQNDSFDAGSEGVEDLESVVSAVIAEGDSASTGSGFFDSLIDLWNSMASNFNVETLKAEAVSNLENSVDTVIENARLFFKQVFLDGASIGVSYDVNFNAVPSADFTVNNAGSADVVVYADINTSKCIEPYLRNGSQRIRAYSIDNVFSSINIDLANEVIESIGTDDVRYQSIELSDQNRVINNALAQSLLTAIGANAIGREAELFNEASLGAYDPNAEVSQSCLFFGGGVVQAVLDSQTGVANIQALIESFLSSSFLDDVFLISDCHELVNELLTEATDIDPTIVSNLSAVTDQAIAIADQEGLLEGRDDIVFKFTINQALSTEFDDLSNIVLDLIKADITKSILQICKANAFLAIQSAGMLLSIVEGFLINIKTFVPNDDLLQSESDNIKNNSLIMADGAKQATELLSDALNIQKDILEIIGLGDVFTGQIPLANSDETTVLSPEYSAPVVEAITKTVEEISGKPAEEVSNSEAKAILDSDNGKHSLLLSLTNFLDTLTGDSLGISKKVNQAFDSLSKSSTKLSSSAIESNPNASDDVNENQDALVAASKAVRTATENMATRIKNVQTSVNKTARNFKSGTGQGLSAGAKLSIGLGATALIGWWWYNRNKR